MQNRTPRIPEQPAPNPVGPHGPDSPEARFTVELATVVTGARRRALRDGDRQIDTAHLLHSLVESDPEVREVFDGGPQLAKVLGYLVQRSIGYGLRWQGSVEDSGAVPVVRDPARDPAREPTAAAEGWSPSAVAAMEGALHRADLRGEWRARGLDLLAALAADGECRAVEVLSRAGVDARWLGERAEERTAEASWWV
ncbi:Clp protease N-terminal domain-containing protein [Streptomyces bacillaris]|uniref:Peptidase n=1 Tax=Streptomyces cavourensis TaxID=67258 RepID=A0ABY5FAP1_9ACTN|nr:MULTISPECIES: Clp protease N-terminal domain-containing protein [Streptomyces]NUW22900.1 peptidase [Streptomyces roseoviolaceus]ATY94623.1 peptidase [Streptomyces cavourensis]MBH0242352.1 peptidase [Streptomyces cavourensis]MCR8940990.1 peptidase [Streptomyces sp. OUCMDZ-4982]NUV82359.1 peptidase [Streptomyces sp. CAI-155]